MYTKIVCGMAIGLFCALPSLAVSKPVDKQSNPGSAAAKNIVVPVYYLTDRNLEGQTYGHERRYKVNCKHRMYYGTSFVTVPNVSHLRESAELERLDWKPTNEKGKKIAPKDRIEVSEDAGHKEQFFRRLTQALDKDKSDTICVYVHGAADSFESASQDAALLEYYLQRPLVMYSWPAASKMFGYIVDNNNSEWSQWHFHRFCRDLMHYKEKHPLRVVFIAHSMGNRFLFRAMHEIYRNGLASDFELISPDMDFDTCRHYLHGFGKIDNGAAVRLYVSNKDRMLKLSQKLFGGYSRLGEHVEEDMGPGREMQEEVVERSGKNALVIAGVKQEVADDEADAAFFERIDFTAVDQGLIGHSIPFKLVADMVNKPQKGAAEKGQGR